MKNQNNPSSSNFWFGFSIGIVSLSLMIYFFGTEKGRKTLKQLLDLTENFEDTVQLISDNLHSNLDNLTDNLKSSPTLKKSQPSTISTVIQNIKGLIKQVIFPF